MASNSAAEVTSGGKERVDKAADILAAAFDSDPVYGYFLHDIPEDRRQLSRHKALHAFIKACALNDGEIVEAADWGSCGVLMPPGRKAENPFTILQAGLIPLVMTVGVTCSRRMIYGYTGTAEELKEKVLSKEETNAFWYVVWMGTATERRHQGLASKVLSYMQDKARGDGRPLWLEATTQNSRRLFSKHGFQDVGEIILGKGVVGPDGAPKKNGEGVTIWGMVWRP
ncbi:hypothetical protein DL768_006511 [Monosporascus sp. mg162]|nr:hypothetical protein DL768_006511 [Monosporascus sp. mg162]